MGMNRLRNLTGNTSVEFSDSGDGHLCPFELRLWQLTYSCLTKFGCPVIFNTMGPDATRRIGVTIRFFVPRSHPDCDAVMAYLGEELKSEVRPDTTTIAHGEELWFWGTSVDIESYNGAGSSFYTDEATSKELAKKWYGELLRKVEESRVEREAHDKIKH